MKNRVKAKRGSALLIVLGFLSFMVVSAVAFSIYMRSERLPSSALRRSVATRHLVKAALARAIGDIDDAVRDEVFPGCKGANGPVMNNSAYGKSWPGSRRRAAWYGRVFMPICWEGPSSDTENISAVDDDDLYFVPASRQGETASTMTLEGLGYIPPPLVNEARLIGPKSWSTKWHYFDYDAGRYAYTALNVSDYFDINKLHAYTNRNSGADGRISLGYLFADTQGKVKTSNAEQFDKIVHETRGGQQNQYGFVSLLDYALAMGPSAASANLTVPFYDYLKSGSEQLFYGQTWNDALTADAKNTLRKDSEYLKVANQIFVTASYCPATNSANTVCDLSNSDWQPFKRADQTPGSLADLLGSGILNTKFREKFKQQFPYISFYAALYDYLDNDDVPTSLVMPCTEQAPMVCAVSVTGVPTVTIKKTSEEVDEETTVDKYSMDVDFSPLLVTATAAFPFKRVPNPDNYKIQVAARVFFSPYQQPTARKLRGLSRTGLDNESDWAANVSGKVVDNSSVVVVSQLSSVSVPKNVTDDSSTEIVIPGLTFSTDVAKDLLLLTVTKKKETDPVTHQTTTKETPAIGDFRFMDESYKNNEAIDNPPAVVPQVALKVRIVNSAGDTVDLVPAMAADDANLNDMRWDAFEAEASNICGSENPFLLFTAQSGGTELKQSLGSMTQVLAGNNQNTWIAGDYDYKHCYCLDPRYNWAPEDWVFETGSTKWLTACDSFFTGAGNESVRDHDVFMGVSNMGYLQSAGELMFIPRVKECLAGSGSEGMWGDLQVDGAKFDGTMHTAVGSELPHYGLMWRCYKPREVGGDDELNQLGIQSGSGGYRVNPYTDNSTIFLAAVANTPVDWWSAATNRNLSGECRSKSAKIKMLDDPEEAIQDYAFGPDSSKDTWEQKQVEAIAAQLCSAMQQNTSSASSWQTGYDNLWSTEFDSDKDDEIFGLHVDSTINDVDRKFLYGFWRDCFGCSQQLFLIFVRAESMALGGSGDVQTPGALGGRAVALVWRDPNPPQNSQDTDYAKPYGSGQEDSNPRPPHKTRILFYHQFD